MQILPILSTLRRHRTAAILIVLEIALTCAIVCNALFLIGDRIERINRPTGVAESELIRVQTVGAGRDEKPAVQTAQDLAALRGIPGVKSASMTNQIPFGNSTWNSSVELDPSQTQRTLVATIYFGGEDLVKTLGVKLIAGRDFTPGEFGDFDDKAFKTPSAIISQNMAERLFPGRSALGGTFYMGNDDPIRVVGIVDHLAHPRSRDPRTEYTAILPVRAHHTLGGNYILRVDPERRREVLDAAVAALQKSAPNRVILERQTFDEMREKFYRADRSMAWLLVGISASLLIVTALGIIGLASFWVQQRTRQIGIRRALGATRRQILRYFQTENFLLATVGIVLGMLLAYGMNQWLMKVYELPRLPALFLPLGAAALWTLGQLAVLGPALRAASVPPAVATRTV